MTGVFQLYEADKDVSPSVIPTHQAKHRSPHIDHTIQKHCIVTPEKAYNLSEDQLEKSENFPQTILNKDIYKYVRQAARNGFSQILSCQ